MKRPLVALLGVFVFGALLSGMFNAALAQNDDEDKFRDRVWTQRECGGAVTEPSDEDDDLTVDESRDLEWAKRDACRRQRAAGGVRTNAVQPSSPGRLPVTGGEVGVMLTLGLVLLSIGRVMIRTTERGK